MFVLTYYKNERELEGVSHYYKPLEELNGMLGNMQGLILTNNERALAELEVKHHFKNIDDISKNVDDASSGSVALMLRAINHYLVQDLEAAMNDMNHALSLDSASWNLFFVRSFIRARQLDAAGLNEANTVDEIIPKQAGGLPDLDYRLVRDDLDKVVELMPDFAYAYFNRGNVAAKLNDFKSAVVDYTKAIELNDRFAEAYFNRGLARLYTGSSEDGISDLSKAGELGLFQAYNVIKRFKYSGKK